MSDDSYLGSTQITGRVTILEDGKAHSEHMSDQQNNDVQQKHSLWGKTVQNTTVRFVHK